MHQIAKITPADYPELLAAVDAGTPQRELARPLRLRALARRPAPRESEARPGGERTRRLEDLGVSTEPEQ